MHDEPSTNATKLNAELQYGKYHAVLSATFPKREESLIDILTWLVKQKHQIPLKANTGCSVSKQWRLSPKPTGADRTTGGIYTGPRCSLLEIGSFCNMLVIFPGELRNCVVARR